MKVFKDANGKEWTVAVNVQSVKRVRDLVKIDLLALATDKGAVISTIMSDPVVLVDVLYALCKPQADRESVTDVAFGEAMLGDAIDNGITALLGDLADFFPKGRRAAMTAALGKIQEADVAIGKMTLENIQKINIADLITSGDSSTSSPPSPESIQQS